MSTETKEEVLCHVCNDHVGRMNKEEIEHLKSQLAHLTQEIEVIRVAAQAVVDVWWHNSGRVFESMGSDNPRATRIDEVVTELRAALAMGKEKAPP